MELRTSTGSILPTWRTARTAPAAALVTIACGLVGVGLSLRYPLVPWLAVALFGSCAVVFFARPSAWLITIPALLPIVAFAPWTGWITFEELDLLVLAAAAGGYARLTLPRPPKLNVGPAHSERASDRGALACLAVTLFAASVLASMARGFTDAGGFIFGWYQGYHEPLNSLRLAKPFFMALLIWPLWRSACNEAPQLSSERLSFGLMLGLLGVSFAAVSERLANTGLLNFSTDYRITALFWEMHVGGAAIDGFLALAMPFAVRELLVSSNRLRWAAASIAVFLGGYACLTTFSRAVYLAIPVGLGVFLWLHTAQGRRLAPDPGNHARSSTLRVSLLLVSAYAAAAIWIFPTSGYRGLLALFGATAVMLALAGPLRRLRPVDWVLGLGMGAALSALSMLCTWMLPKGAYVSYALSAALAVSTLGRLQLYPRRLAGSSVATEVFALAGFVSVIVGMSLVALHWGGASALKQAWPVSAVLLAVLLFASRRRSNAWPESLRWQGLVLGTMVMVAGVVGVFGGGSYMSDRIDSDSKTFGGRLTNWRLGLAMLDTPIDWAFGKGLGRFPANYALATAGTDKRPGDYRLVADVRGHHLVLGAGTHPLGWLELLRFSQRVSSPQIPATVRFDVRATSPVSLQFEVCTKHLLYSQTCLAKTVGAAPKAGEWQTLQVQLEGTQPSRGAWFAPNLIVFSVSVADQGGRAELDNMELSGPDGLNLLANADFNEGFAHWFFTSDGYHTPWHIEGIFMNALFDQGAVGAGLLILMVGGGLWRLSFGSARNNLLAPAMAAALVGFSAAGIFSSVTDVPRVAFLFYFLVLLSLTLRGPRLSPG